MTQKSKFLSFMTKVKPNNGTKQNQTFSMGLLKSDIIFHWSQNTKVFQ